MTSAAEALRAAVPRLARAGVSEAAQDARRLLAHAMGLAPDRLLLHLQDPLNEGAAWAFEAALAARERRQPLSQILGRRDFYGLVFRVTPDVLDPRPDTETLVDEALRAPFQRLLDLGTGSGCILLSCLANSPGASGLGIDVSAKALAVARANAQDLGLTGRAEFALGNWLEGLEGRFDLIVSNPPYITQAEMADLDPEVRDFEPHLALSPGGDGLAAYRVIAAGAGRHLQGGGRLLLEIGWRQGRDVCQILADQGFADIRVLPDLDGRDRLVAARLP